MQWNNKRTSRMDGGLSLSVTITITFSLVALITATWAVVNHQRTSSLENQVQEQQIYIVTLRENATATAFTMDRTDIAPPTLSGTIYIGTSGSGVVVASNLPPAGDNGVFQLWLLGAGDDSAVATGTLQVTETMLGFALIPADSRGYTRIAISLEPSAANTTPSGGFLLVADVNPARGDHHIPLHGRVLWQNHIE